MGIIAEIEDKFMDDIDNNLVNDEEYKKAFHNLHSFIHNNVPEEKEDECSNLVGKLTAAVQHVSICTGMRLGAKITSELLK